MEANMNMEQRLWDLIDGNITPQEKILVEKLIAEQEAWKAKYKELLEVNQLLQHSDIEAPSMRFTKNVMEEISRMHIAPATKTYINKKIIWGITFFFITMIVGFLIYGFAQVQSGGSTDTTITENVNRIDFSRFFSNSYVNVLMMINLIVGIFLLDNYLGRKRKKFRGEF